MAAPDPLPSIHLAFQTNSMLATKITRNSSDTTTPAYTLSTDKHGATTSLFLADTDTLPAKLARKELFPDTVTLPTYGGAKPKKVKQWLSATTVAEGVRAYAIETSAGNFFLLRHPQHRLALYTPDLTTILAHWIPQTADTPLTLVVIAAQPDIIHLEEAIPEIIAAFVYEEQNMRIVEKHTIVAGRSPGFRIRAGYAVLGMLPYDGEVSLAALAGSRGGNAWQ
ncbi:hypothetical protein C8R46DRAFT_1358200 [Mycena filopes]|nr:hypothetical protein C8R46DRAFT_1358200 [Mycena filopes]